MHDVSSREVSDVGRSRRGWIPSRFLDSWLPLPSASPELSADSGEEPAPRQPRNACFSRRSLGIGAALGLLTLLGATANGPLRRHTAELLHPLWLWSTRHGFSDPATTAECVWDASIAASYLFRGAFELAEATQDCPEVDEVRSELYRVLEEHPDYARPARGPSPSLSSSFGGTLTVDNASQEVSAACANAQAVLNSLQARRPHLRRNRSFAELAARRLSEPSPVFEAIQTHGEVKVLKQLCTSEIAGTIGAWSWVAGYLAATTSECTKMIYLHRFCASDIARTVAAISDVVQAAAGIASACTAEARRVRNYEHYKKKEEEIEDLKELAGDRRLQQAVSELPASPVDRLRERDLEDDDDLPEKIRDHNKEARLDRIHQGLCGINAIQGALFLGRAAMEINGAKEHCSNDWDEVEKLRCAANSQGAFAAFAVTSHVLAEATAQCQESMGKLNLEGFCAASTSQVIHALTELSAALCVLAADCTLMEIHPKGRPQDIHKAILEKAAEVHRRTGRTFNGIYDHDPDDIFIWKPDISARIKNSTDSAP